MSSFNQDTPGPYQSDRARPSKASVATKPKRWPHGGLSARFGGTCRFCGQPIERGQAIEKSIEDWGKVVWHHRSCRRAELQRDELAQAWRSRSDKPKQLDGVVVAIPTPIADLRSEGFLAEDLVPMPSLSETTEADLAFLKDRYRWGA